MRCDECGEEKAAVCLNCFHESDNDAARLEVAIARKLRHFDEMERHLRSLLEMSSACTGDVEIIENNRRRDAARAALSAYENDKD